MFPQSPERQKGDKGDVTNPFRTLSTRWNMKLSCTRLLRCQLATVGVLNPGIIAVCPYDNVKGFKTFSPNFSLAEATRHFPMFYYKYMRLKGVYVFAKPATPLLCGQFFDA